MSDLICGTRFWTDINSAPNQYPWLACDEKCDVLIIGGGITGALAAYRFAKANINTVLISKSPIGYMGTSVSTGLIDYSINDDFSQLISVLGKENASKYYNICLEGLINLEEIVNSLNTDVNFLKKDSIVYSDKRTLRDKIHGEYLYRKSNGFDSEYIDKQKSRDLVSFNLESGILSTGISCSLNPYLFTHALIDEATKSGARVYENTAAYKIDYDSNNLLINTSTRKVIDAKKIIMATGYDDHNYLDVFKKDKFVFTGVTRKLDNFSGYEQQQIIYNIDEPFTSIRTTTDSRIIISGCDSKFLGLDKRLSKYINYQKIMDNKILEFQNKLNLMFCGIRNIDIEYKSVGVLPQTLDGLPVIGEDDRYPNIYFDYVSGYNGIVQSEFASRLLLSLYQGEINEDIYMFYPDRK